MNAKKWAVFGNAGINQRVYLRQSGMTNLKIRSFGKKMPLARAKIGGLQPGAIDDPSGCDGFAINLEFNSIPAGCDGSHILMKQDLNFAGLNKTVEQAMHVDDAR